MSSSSGIAVSVSEVSEVVVTGPAVKSKDISPAVHGSVNDAWEEPLCSR